MKTFYFRSHLKECNWYTKKCFWSWKQRFAHWCAAWMPHMQY